MADQGSVWLFIVGQSPVTADLALQPIGCAPALSVMYSAAAAAVAACGAI